MKKYLYIIIKIIPINKVAGEAAEKLQSLCVIRPPQLNQLKLRLVIKLESKFTLIQD